MILSRYDLRGLVDRGVVFRDDGGDITIDHVSISLHLDSQFLVYDQTAQALYPPCEARTREVVLPAGVSLDFPVGARVLACSLEQIAVPLDVMAFVQTKGSLARGFVMVHLCDGQIDPGYRGKITFELANLSNFSYKLNPGMPVAQLFFMRLTTPLDAGYDGKYQDSTSPTPMRP